MKKLHKSNSQKMIAGVCGGIAEYFGFDPTIVRLIFAAPRLTRRPCRTACAVRFFFCAGFPYASAS